MEVRHQTTTKDVFIRIIQFGGDYINVLFYFEIRSVFMQFFVGVCIAINIFDNISEVVVDSVVGESSLFLTPALLLKYRRLGHLY